MMSILLLEDETIMRETLRDYLMSEGYHVITASNGKAALDILDKVEMPKLILLDMQMPVMDGWEFAVNLRERFTNPAPLIIMTAAVDADKRARDINAVDFIEKPLSLDELLIKIHKVFST